VIVSPSLRRRLPPSPARYVFAGQEVATMTSKDQRYAKMELRGSSYTKNWKTDLKSATCADPGCELCRRRM
jgi:hypothetical protein